jgi:hypothetical protein
VARRVNRKKEVKIAESIASQKEAKLTPGISFYDRKAAWRISRIQMADPYGWHDLPLEKVVYIQRKLSEFEKKTWNEIFQKEKHWNHPLPVSDLKCPEARQWMRRNMPDQDTLWTLRFSGAERVWGIYSEGVYIVVFWDPKHLIWETPKK